MFPIKTKLPNDVQDSSPSVNTMTYDVMLTLHFDKEYESERDEVYDILDNELEFKKDWQKFDCDFDETKSSEFNDKKYKLPHVTFLRSQISGYESKKVLAEYLIASLNKIFSDKKVKGRYAFLIDKTETPDEINGAAFEF
jgi:hypothetical protein